MYRLPIGFFVCSLALLWVGASSAALHAKAPPRPTTVPAPETDPPDDPGYLQVLKAYRGQLSREELNALENRDPAPALYRELKSGARRGIVRLFAALPDDRHRELRESGYLKWPVASLPAEQRRWVREMAKELEGQGEGPFPVEGKTDTVTGFARIDVEGLEEPQYSWWISAPRAKRPAWVTVVRAVGLLLQVHFQAHREQLAALLDRPESATVPPEKWLKLKEPDRPEPEAQPTLLDEKEYRQVVRAYRGELDGKALEALTAADPLIGKRLRMKEPADQALNRLFARLTEKEHLLLLTTGRLVWHTPELTREQRKLLEPVVERLNRQAKEGGESGDGRDLYSLIPHAPTYFGFALVNVPGVEKPVVSWWIKSVLALHPSWVSLTNGPAVENPHYYRAHLEALGQE